jgi:hypothetical protein
MTKHGVAKRPGVNRAELNSVLMVVSIEEAVRQYLNGKPGTLRLSLERVFDAIDRENEASRRGLEHSEGLSLLATS